MHKQGEMSFSAFHRHRLKSVGGVTLHNFHAHPFSSIEKWNVRQFAEAKTFAMETVSVHTEKFLNKQNVFLKEQRLKFD